MRDLRARRQVIMIGTHPHAKGGIATVVTKYRQFGLFEKWRITYLCTHAEASAYRKFMLALSAYWHLIQLLIRGRAGLIHIHVASRASTWRKSIFAFTALLFHVPYVLHMHGAAYMNFFSLIETDDARFGVKRIRDIAQPALDFLNVRFALAVPGFTPPEGWRAAYEGRDGVLLENLNSIRRFYAPQRLVTAEEPLREQLELVRDFRREVIVEGLPASDNSAPQGLAIHQVRAGKFRLRVTSLAPTFLASSQPFSPGWNVFVGSERTKVHRVNGAFIGFFVPAGEHEVELKYRPWSFVAGVLIGLLSLLLGLGLCLRRPAAGLLRVDRDTKRGV